MNEALFLMGDQLNEIYISKFKHLPIFMCELKSEATYVKHHKQKITFFFASMRNFANEAKSKGFNFIYTGFEKAENTHSFSSEILRIQKEYKIKKFFIFEPSEFRVLEEIKILSKSVEIEILKDHKFLITTEEFGKWANGKKELKMEYFYREVRKKFNILMENGNPEGGKWNYDSENRKSFSGKISVPERILFTKSKTTKEVINLIEKYFSDHFGDITDFNFATTRKEALEALNYFTENLLENFGVFQDVMKENEPFLFHSVISMYINIGFLMPLECTQAAILKYRKDKNISLFAVEGFVRQIIGWREFIKGVYSTQMPHYKTSNYLEFKNKLPDFYWTGETKMNCIKNCVNQTKQYAYTHHIQRLMILGNFATLLGVHPDFLNEWFLIVYVDALEWVEMPNVTGMVLYADGGLVATKPYVSSGAYINRMSDYCKNCHYNVKEKTGKTACPFNFLYWNFLIKHEKKLKNNPRLRIAYMNLKNISQNEVELNSEMFVKELNINPAYRKYPLDSE